jgi:hypothetical protein
MPLAGAVLVGLAAPDAGSLLSRVTCTTHTSSTREVRVT